MNESKGNPSSIYLVEEMRDSALTALHQQFEQDADSQSQYLSKSKLADRLFAKAGKEFFRLKTLDDLVHITEKASSLLETFHNNKKEIIVEHEVLESRSALYIAIGDRPFLINSIRECLIDFHLTIHAFLHPIILEDGQRTSLSYIETATVPQEQLSVLKRRIEETLQHVVLSTTDYTPMLVRVETLARFLDKEHTAHNYPVDEQREVAAFLRWLAEGGLIFLGYGEWSPKQDNSLPAFELQAKHGTLRSDDALCDQIQRELSEDITRLIDNNDLFLLSKLRSVSVVQRKHRFTSICVQELNSDGSLRSIHTFIGLLTSQALVQESSSVPLIRRKVERLLQSEDVIEQSHDYKNMINIIDSMPKEEALRLELDDLRQIVHTILDIQNKNETRVSVRYDVFQRGVSLLIVMPRDRFNADVRHRIQEHIEQVFRVAPGSSEYYLDLSNRPHARFYFHLATSEANTVPIDIAQLKLDIVKLTRAWKDNLEDHILSSSQFSNSSAIWYTYGEAFETQYQASESVDDCIYDISLIEQLNQDAPLRVGMRADHRDESKAFVLVIYSLGQDYTISRALPVLENAGLEVINERAHEVKPSGQSPVYLHRFLVRPKSETYISQETFEKSIAPGLELILLGQARNDSLNTLLITTGLHTEAISLLRAYCGFLWQVSKFATRSALLDALAQFPSAANQLWNMFEIRFNPELQSTIKSREQRFEASLTHFYDSLRDVKDITQDRILRALGSLLANTVRTNFYTDAAALALKIRSSDVDIMPHPRPYFEIYVRSAKIEGVHLRAGKIARGGLRFSDRHQDFRSEVLGLMKTQTIKNALIVPTGAKGGFIVKNLPEDRSERQAQVEEGYKDFIRALLSVTDNRIQDEITPPERVVCYDKPDPYLVVAADKGTATFSDIANRIATEEFSFWLQDAFASGGSHGYDHKLYGITARGAWESVLAHFNNMGLDYVDGTFSAIGIGDMSGDVFGNGLLLSERVKLLAAFNHMHIFIDPNPEPQASFSERQRLFDLPHSQWTDYTSNLISQGGGVYGRFDKEIRLSPEAREALSVPEGTPEVLDGEGVIHLILQAKADLLWNGGIGTYVKSKIESHADVNDGTNDRVRVNADQLRVRVVGEGGNLGFTQLARIEFARRRGNVHTDAIDNSGGVDLSDHEVNLKILFASLIDKNKLSLPERNELLKEIAPDVVHDVLQHNKNHGLQLTVGVHRSRRNIEYFRTLLRELVRRGYLNRALEYLPEDEELIDRANRKQGLYKPELAICIGAVKIWVSDELVRSALPNDPMLQSFLVDYFPEELREKYHNEILAHPLAKYIISTQATNVLIDAIGITFVHRMCLAHSTTPITVIKCALAAEAILGARRLRSSLEQFDTFKDYKTYLKFIDELNGALRDVTSWFISWHEHLDLAEICRLYQEPFESLAHNAESMLTSTDKELFLLRLEKYSSLGLDENAAKFYALFPRVTLYLEMLWAARESKQTEETAARIYTFLLDKLQIDSLLALEHAVEPIDKWEHELLWGSFRRIRRSVSHITRKLLTSGLTDEVEILVALQESESYERILLMIEELKERPAGVSALAVMAQHLARFSLN